MLKSSIIVACAASVLVFGCSTDTLEQDVTESEQDVTEVVEPEFIEFDPLPTDCVSGARCEVSFTIDAEHRNPFDPDEITVDARITNTGDDSWYIRPAFYYQGFTNNDGAPGQPDGNPGWRIRFRPDTPGSFNLLVNVTTPDGTVSSTTQTIEVGSPESPWHGQVMPADDDLRYLAYENGSPYFPIGENMCWWDVDVTDYTGKDDNPGWMKKLADNGGNFIRLWMATWGFSPEWSYPEGSRLGDYSARQDRAWALDRVFERADELGLMIELCMFSHGQFSTQFNSEWDANPYNTINGGFLDDPRDFFTDPEALRLTKNRLRYIVARWGAEPALLAWELFNEVDLTNPPDDGTQFAVVQRTWHESMAGWLKDLDPHRHMVTSSISSFGTFWGLDEAIFSLDDIDFAQVHNYGNELMKFDIVAEVTGMAESYARFNKPVFFAELGVHSAGPAETAAIDPSFIGLHDLIWAPVFGPSAGSGMTWWWDNLIDPNDQYFQFRALADFIDGIDWAAENFILMNPGTSDATNLTAFALFGNTTALVWVKNTAERYWDLLETADPAFIEDATIDLSDLPDGNWTAQWRDTFGTTVYEQEIVPVDNAVTALPVPGFTHDIALRLVLTDDTPWLQAKAVRPRPGPTQTDD